MMWPSVQITFSLLGVVLFLACAPLQTTNGANILGLFTSHSPSHLIVHMSVMKALAEAGHNVTVVSGLEPKVTHKSIHHIVIPPKEGEMEELNEAMSNMASKENSILNMLKSLFGQLSMLITMQVDVTKDKRFKALYETPDTKFDLAIVGFFMNDYQLGIGAKLNCPLIVDWTSATMEFTDSLVGNPREVAYVPNNMVQVKSAKHMTFFERVVNFMSTVFFRGLRIFVEFFMASYYVQVFGNDKDFPSYHDMKKNVSLVFVNGHFSEGPIRPNVPALVEIGGIQIKDKPDPLPKDIFDFLESSEKHGAILFSLGSNLKGSNIKPELVKIIFKTLSSLKQNVIWKWEDLKKTPGSSPNILYKKWMPQDDILAHPNLKLFITHAGKGGLAEAQYHAVPMVALPVFADQNTNAQNLVNAGYGQQLKILEITETDLKNAINEVLSNPIYAENLKKFSSLYRDRPLSPKESVVYWSEYVIRHHGATHMQSPLVHLNELQRASIDVLAFLVLVLYIIWRLLKLVVKFTWKKLCGRTKEKTATKYKKVKNQ